MTHRLLLLWYRLSQLGQSRRQGLPARDQSRLIRFIADDRSGVSFSPCVAPSNEARARGVIAPKPAGKALTVSGPRTAPAGPPPLHRTARRTRTQSVISNYASFSPHSKAHITHISLFSCLPRRRLAHKHPGHSGPASRNRLDTRHPPSSLHTFQQLSRSAWSEHI